MARSSTTLTLLAITGWVALAIAQSGTSNKLPESFTVTIKTSAEEVRVGTQVLLEIKILNTSAEPITARSGFQAYDGDPTYEYSCRDSSGRSVSKDIAMVGSAHDPPTVKPGGTYSSTVILNRVCDIRQPGRYEIQLSRGIPMGSRDHVVKSNKIAIAVTP
jgi:hypothetical protein